MPLTRVLNSKQYPLFVVWLAFVPVSIQAFSDATTRTHTPPLIIGSTSRPQADVPLPTIFSLKLPPASKLSPTSASSTSSQNSDSKPQSNSSPVSSSNFAPTFIPRKGSDTGPSEPRSRLLAAATSTNSGTAAFSSLNDEINSATNKKTGSFKLKDENGKEYGKEYFWDLDPKVRNLRVIRDVPSVKVVYSPNKKPLVTFRDGDKASSFSEDNEAPYKMTLGEKTYKGNSDSFTQNGETTYYFKDESGAPKFAISKICWPEPNVSTHVHRYAIYEYNESTKKYDIRTPINFELM